MNKLKFISIISLIVVFVISCSVINDLKEKFSKKDEKEDTETTNDKEQTSETTSSEDLKCYNAYIDVSNKVSEAMENLHKSYLQEVPEPKSIRKNSMIFVIGSTVYLTMLETAIKEYNRSLYDNGELAKLKPDNEDMKIDIEKEFKELLKIIEEYKNTSKTVIDYYSEKKYEENLSLAEGYDNEIKAKYEKYKNQFDKFESVIKKYKPKRKQRNPDDISNPDEKAIAILQNAYENTLDNAEGFLEKFEKINKDSDIGGLLKQLDEMEQTFQSDKNKILSAEYSDMTKHYKYSFEDYFSKTVGDFIKEARGFLNNVQNKKVDEKKFSEGYDETIRYYNYMINAYNSNTQTLNMFRVF
ncbi:MAG: hypothetical protein ACRDFC_01545 [Ignavibacteria bacterium]